MFVIIQVGANQFRVSEGDNIQAEEIDGEAGKSVKLDKVLMVANGSDIRVGNPYLKGVNITAKVIRHHQAKKVTAFKFRKRKNSSSKKAYRRPLTTLNITKIEA